MVINQNLFVYTSKFKMLGGTFGSMFDLVIANASLTAPVIGVASWRRRRIRYLRPALHAGLSLQPGRLDCRFRLHCADRPLHARYKCYGKHRLRLLGISAVCGFHYLSY